MVDYTPELTPPGLQQPVLVVANHPTLLDVTAMLSAHPEMCCGVRARTFLNPGYFLLQLCCGHVLARGGFAGGIAVLEDIERRLLAGHSVLVFLEGTRSPIGGLHAFRPGSIAMALRSGTPIQPVLVDVSEPMLNPHLSSRVVPIGVKMKVEVLPLLRQEGEGANTSVSARRLTEQLGTMYRKHLGITAAPND